ncbi:MAG: primosomal protein N', partial [Gammaproteobacteria bacterium]|nr:primosomal protein N' [Gammaproteobacteria bacterium]
MPQPADKTSPTILRVAINTPVNKLFDYLAPKGRDDLRPGMRVRVPFGRRKLVGIVAAVGHDSEWPLNKLKPALEVPDQDALFDPALVDMLSWAAGYYQCPPGEVFAAALPVALRQGNTPEPEREYSWSLTDAGKAVDVAALEKRAPVQAAFVRTLAGGARSAAELRELNSGWRKTMQTFIEKGWVECTETEVQRPETERDTPPQLSDAQQAAVAGVPDDGFHPCLLEGVTGSGKTEVYLHLIAKQIAARRQSLVLVPEIGLTPQLLDRFAQRLGNRIAVLHSGLTDTQRLNNWLRAHSGEADVIIGTRSAIFAPLPRPGLIIVDEEHDGSFKQQDGFRYSARDLAVWRAHQLNIPVLLGSATPALESLHNAREGRYRHLQLPQRAGNAEQPEVRIVDLRKYPLLNEGLSQPLLAAMRTHLEAGDQVLVYLNRRGFAPTLLCPTCGTTVECDRCDARLVWHQRRNKLVCHHCGHERRALTECDECSSELVPVGQGTEKLEQTLTDAFPDYPLVRIDRDTTRKRGELERRLAQVRDREARIVLGTQMLTKGHDFPDVTCVAVVDSDQGLFGTDFRSGERLAQSVLQVAGRAGRGDKPGEVWLQTWHPEHPLLTKLLQEGYAAFAT